MYTPRGVNKRSRASPFTATPQGNRSAQSKRVANLFTPQRKSPFVKSQGNKSCLQTSQLLEETQNHRVEKFGTPLPVLITEALTYADKNTEISVKIDPSGWAWLVGARKLFVWRYKQGPSGRNVLCKELTLPPSDLAHNAARVCVIPNNADSQSASCIAVSPEGVVRYWPNIAYEASSVEISAELKGEECDCVVNFMPYGCLLATTTSSLSLLSPVIGQNTIICHPLKGSQGMFAGIGRRMSSLIFGAAPGQATGAPLQAIIAGKAEEEERPFFVLSGTNLQKWIVADGNVEKLHYQIDADRLFREALARKVWEQDSIQLTQLNTWLLDMQHTRDGVVILGAGVNFEAQPVMHYAFITISTESSGTPSSVESITVLDFVRRYQEERESQLLNYKILYPAATGEEIYMFDEQAIVMTTVSGGIPEDLPAPGGRLLGAGSCDGVAVFFSITQGLFCISSTHKEEVSMLDETAQEMVSRHEVSALQASSSQLHELSMSEDKSARLRAAFLMACGGNVKDSLKVLEELFPGMMDAGPSTEMDRLIASLSRDLLDDYPATDPRWAESVRSDSTSSTTSLIILQQLKDKQRAHEYVIPFLKKVNLWERLKSVPVRDSAMSTRLLLCEHAEKLEAAICLREMHSKYSTIIDQAIRKVLDMRAEAIQSRNLTPPDLFYREVSQVQDIFEAMLDLEGDFLKGDYPPADTITAISTVNAIMGDMLTACLQYRQSKANMYQSDGDQELKLEYIPWTSAVGSKGCRTLLGKQYTRTLQSAIPEAKDVETKGILFQQLLTLADIILDGYSCQLASLGHMADSLDRYTQLQEKFHQDRQNLIRPFLEHEQYERAASLAEKYVDFEILIRLCEDTGNTERIQRYKEQFADKGFSDVLFSWYMREGKRGKLLSQSFEQQPELRQFLQADDLQYLKWLNDIQAKNFREAHETLLQLGRNETEYLAKKKTLLSLSKLAALAAEDMDDDLEDGIKGIDEEQDLIVHQELLPADLIEGLNIDPDKMKVLSPLELIELYVSDENSTATEYDFKKALDLLQFIDREDPSIDFNSLQLHIWTKAVLRDRAVWTHTPTGDPLDSIKDTIFFKTADLAFREGADPREFLPDLRAVLQSTELGDLKDDTGLQYLLRAGYEHIQRVVQ